MINKLKKYVPHIIAATLIVAIFGIALALVLPPNAPGELYVPEDDVQNTAYTPEQPKPSYIRAIPKLAQGSEEFLYYQDITGNGEVLLANFFQTTLGGYIVCESECTQGDIQGEKRCVGLALIDSLGNVTKTYTVPATSSQYYVDSCLTPAGIVVITTNALKEIYYVNIISYELDNNSVVIINRADKTTIFPTADSFIIIAQYSDESLVYSYSAGKLSFTAITGGSVVEAFDYGSYYALFINVANGYSILKLNKSTLSSLGETFISGLSLASVTPIFENGKQKLILIETNGAVYARKISGLNAAESAPASLGSFTVNSVCPADGKLILSCSGRLQGLVYLDYDLSCYYGDNSSFAFVTTILDSNFANGAYYYLALNSNNELLLISGKNNTVTTRTLSANCQSAKFIFHPNGTLTIAYQTIENSLRKVALVGIN